MATIIMVAGRSGSGKSFSIRNLEPSSTFVLSPFKDELPFPGWKKSYKRMVPSENKQGNLYLPRSFQEATALLKTINEGNKYTTVVLDDFQFFQSFRAIETAGESGFGKYILTAELYLDLFKKAKGMREDVTVFFLSQMEKDDFGEEKARSGSKFINQTIGSLESFFNVVLRAGIDSSMDPYTDKMYGYFRTRTDGSDLTKSPFGLFKDEIIPNDLQLVLNSVTKFNEG